MPVGVKQDHLELGSSLRAWAAGLAGTAAVREAETDAAASFATVWKSVVEAGLTSIAVPENAGGGGGDLLDQLVAVEAAAQALVPGPVLATTLVGLAVTRAAGPGAADPACDEVLTGIVGGDGAAVAVAGALSVDDSGARGELSHVLDVVDARWLLAPTDAGRWVLVRSTGWTAEPGAGIDLSRRSGRVRVAAKGDDIVHLPALDDGTVRRLLVALAAAEAAGVAQWCLDTAVAYAKVREQFGAPIGSFQAVKHLCAQMLETTESVAAVAWDLGCAADAGLPAEEADYAADVAATVAFDGAVSVAQDCIQVLGGIGFTFEHDAHLYLRRAIALRAVVTTVTGASGEAAVRLAGRASGGRRRAPEVDLDGADAEHRPAARAAADAVAALPPDQQRAALVRSGHLMPHWPEPYGLAAGAVQQLVVDEELARAGVTRPDLKIGGWAAPTIIEHGTDEQRERFVRPTLLGDLTWCQLFSEPGAGSDLASLSTRADRVEGGWTLTGQKVWTSLAHRADWAICLARTDREVARHRGITYFLLDMTSPGIDIRPLREITGDAMFNEVFLDEVFVPDDCVVGAPGDGWKLARTTLANERVAMAGTKLGLSTERAVELLAGLDSPPAAELVGRQVALATVCQQLGVRSVLRSIGGRGPGPESSVAKLLGVRNRQEASELVVDLHGPAALLTTDDPQLGADVHEMLLTRCLSIAGGTTQVLRNVVAERVLGLPRG
ncbi:acyl-CoA dehydrogenase, middle domain protein [Aeromicrobium marinum DSM 15272]|uniref:Acyl-CoA dehydrogenase, middle domain protein n=1 Tax=Aeromicrobium marinum DSM 15272 TaxID=585531 RepID=E2SEU4_9ACTN|nr:acyl-CoA dehydrogenase family protein [Aeromicrobium marinum]EFQ82391.1 acyl-CoA dehydrogenase, middle domain protein [Aeromicrobium marinum DSM 15272]